MPSWITNAYDAANAFAVNNPALYPIILLVLPVLFAWLYKQVTSFTRADRRQRLEIEITQLKKYQSEDKLPHIAEILASFLRVTLATILFEVFLYYLSLLLSPRVGPLDPFAYFYALMIYSYIILLIIQRLHRIMHPRRYVIRLERQLAVLK
jgi:hypothetical protein